jgi:hypothetical protein
MWSMPRGLACDFRIEGIRVMRIRFGASLGERPCRAMHQIREGGARSPYPRPRPETFQGILCTYMHHHNTARRKHDLDLTTAKLEPQRRQRLSPFTAECYGPAGTLSSRAHKEAV